MWAALSLPLVVLAGTLFMERFETAVLASERAKSTARTESPLWTISSPRVSLARGRAKSPRPESLSPFGDGAELEVASGAVTG